MNLSVMTFHESFGDLPKFTLRMINKFNVSQSDFDTILMAYGWEFGSPEIDWSMVNDHIMGASTSGTYRPSRYL